ncbi:MAG: DMT family transporter [Candidatus Omnitrophica bacterium]|nr:DMT family transporter [Candidatus Omnitrophota bacterium]
MKALTRSKDRIQADLMMLLAAIIWGGGFVAQRLAARYLEYSAFNGIRFGLAGLILLPVGLHYLGKPNRQLFWILPAGSLLFAGSTLQQVGLKTTTAGSAGFITGVYVVLVPFFLALLWREKIPILNWLAAIAALSGTFLLSTGGKAFMPSQGDLLELAGAVLWAFHVIVVGLAVRKLNVFTFSAGQFLLCSLINLVFSQFNSPITWQAIQLAWPAILYGGVFSAALGFTLQAVGQSKAPTADAALILSLEAVFGAIFGAIFLYERMDFIQIVGCSIIMISILMAQIISIRKPVQPKKAELMHEINS